LNAILISLFTVEFACGKTKLLPVKLKQSKALEFPVLPPVVALAGVAGQSTAAVDSRLETYFPIGACMHAIDPMFGSNDPESQFKGQALPAFGLWEPAGDNKH
jgi:hypothetical protein